jgi:hypothetical protein
MTSSSPFSLRKSPQSNSTYGISNNINQNQLLNQHSQQHIHSNNLIPIQSHQSKSNQNNLVSSNKTNGTSKIFLFLYIYEIFRNLIQYD